MKSNILAILSSLPIMTTPTLAITMGDAAGIGPEIIAGAWTEIAQTINGHPVAYAVVYGNPEIMRRAVKLRNDNIDVLEIDSIDALPCSTDKNIMPCLRCGNDDVTQVQPGTVDARAGEAAYRAVVTAIDDAKIGKIKALVTAPIHKGALNLAGYKFPGHTEILAERCGVTDFAMMLYLGASPIVKSSHGLAVVHVTLHTAMRNIFEQITVASVKAKARLANGFMQQMIGTEGAKPRIGVCSLNPHAGEDGLFGREETEIIRPAVEQARAEGLRIDGPFPADTIMIDAKNGRYDAIVAMFHDQGHIALKLLNMHGAVNVTLGLPIIRTSVAHGTAFDKAWQGVSETGSMIEAVRVAERLANTALQSQ